jgi:foldase protein PrsA
LLLYGPMSISRTTLFLVGAALLACGSHNSGGMSGPTLSGRMNSATQPAAQSNDVLQRPRKTSKAWVKHILIGWRDLEPIYGSKMDPRARGRSKTDALRLAKDLSNRARAGEKFEMLMKTHSEDKGSASSGMAYEVHPKATLVAAFRRMGLRLNVGEVGVARSPYGWHIMKRID